MKIFRSLSSRNAETFRAAVELCMKAPQLQKVASIKRRFDIAFVGYDAEKKKTILRFAEDNPNYLQDLRVISLISEALRADSQLQQTALSIVGKEKWLKENPAIAATLMELPDQPVQVATKLPDYRFFQENVEPIFQALGSDEKNCISCHKSHPILRLRPLEGASADERLQEHYRNSLRVVNLQEPEKSLLLLKPTLPAPPTGTVIESVSRDVHGGDVRWEKDSPSYQTILNWIRTARQSQAGSSES